MTNHNYQKRVASLRKMEPGAPNAELHIPDPDYAKALVKATGLPHHKVAYSVGLATSTLRSISNGTREFSYPVQYALENLVSSTSHTEEPTCTPDLPPKPQK